MQVPTTRDLGPDPEPLGHRFEVLCPAERPRRRTQARTRPPQARDRALARTA